VSFAAPVLASGGDILRRKVCAAGTWKQRHFELVLRRAIYSRTSSTGDTMAAEGTNVEANGIDRTGDRKRKADVLVSLGNGNGLGKGSVSANGTANGHEHGNGMAESNGAAGTSTAPADNGVVIEPASEESATVKLVQRKWQMCSCVHFFSSFKGVLPLSSIAIATATALSPLLLERAVAEPASDSVLSVVYRDVIASLLVALKEIPAKHAAERWYPALTKFVTARPQEFPDCFDGPPNRQENILERFGTEGMSFIFHATWKCRLGLLHGMCDIVAEEAECMREVIKETERLSSATRQEIEARHYRLVPLGRCSQKRFYYCVGGCRIYSGYKRKGAGGVVVECSDVPSMRNLVAALEGSDKPKDAALGAKIRSWYLGPLLESEERKRRKMDRDLAVEAQREESRRRNADRPRRARASYI
jgi:hypothetical protein